MAANCSARLASSSPASCRLIAAIDGDIRHACGYAFFDHHYRPVLASHRIASRYYNPGGRIAGGCVTGATHVVGCAWHTPDVAVRDGRLRAADGTVERIRNEGYEGGRVFQACIRTCGGIFSGSLV
jgi:hypothetical protein